MNIIETFKVGNRTVKIVIDEDVESPRNDGRDNCDMFILFHDRYSLANDTDYKPRDFNSWDEMEKQLIKDYKPVELRRIRMYDHSGISISSSNSYPYTDQWDSSMIGFALISRESALKEMSAKKVTKKVKEWAKKYLDATISEYDSYLRGECYGYIVEDENENELDSCWGFIGDIDYVKQEATESAKSTPAKTEDPNQLKFASI